MNFSVRITKIYYVDVNEDETYQANIERALNLDAEGCLGPYVFETELVNESEDVISEEDFEDLTK